MGTLINSDNSGYRENAAVDNWASEYAKRSLKAHQENEVLDHADGCVTYEKLGGDVKDVIAEIDTNAVTAKVAAVSANEAAMQAKNAIVNMTVSSELIPSSEQVSIEKTEQGGVVNLHFGIPECDQLIESTDCVSGGKGFKITEMGWIDEAEGTGYYVLGNVIGLEAGMVISVSAGISVSGEQTILAVSQSNNKIVVSGYRENSLNTNGDDIENCVVRNYITVVGRPDLGHIDIGFNAVATGQDTMAQDANTFTSGRDTKAIGKYGVALNSNTKAGYACLATGADNEILGVWSFGTGRRNKSCGEGCTILGEEGYISPDAWYSLIGNGQGNKVLAPFGAAFGQGNTVGSANQVVIGVNNDVDENGKYVFVIGNGGYLGEARSNAFTVDWQGNADMRGLKIKGKLIEFNSFATDSDINTVNSRINTTNTNVAGVKSQISVIDSDIDTINSDIVTIENQMTELRTYTRTPQIVGTWIDGTPIYRIAFEKAVTDGNVNLNIIPFINDEGIRIVKSEYLSSSGSISSVTDRKEDVTYTEDGGVNIAYTNTGDTIVYGCIEAATSKHNINHVDGDDYYGEYLNSSGVYHLTGEAAHNIKIPVPEELVGKKIKCTLKLKTTHTGGICDLSWGYGEDNIHQISNAAQGTGEFEELTLTTNGKASANEWFKLRFFSWHHDYVDIKDVKVSEA